MIVFSFFRCFRISFSTNWIAICVFPTPQATSIWARKPSSSCFLHAFIRLAMSGMASTTSSVIASATLPYFNLLSLFTICPRKLQIICFCFCFKSEDFTVSISLGVMALSSAEVSSTRSALAMCSTHSFWVVSRSMIYFNHRVIRVSCSLYAGLSLTIAIASSSPLRVALFFSIRSSCSRTLLKVELRGNGAFSSFTVFGFARFGASAGVNISPWPA